MLKLEHVVHFCGGHVILLVRNRTQRSQYLGYSAKDVVRYGCFQLWNQCLGDRIGSDQELFSSGSQHFATIHKH